MSNPSFSNIELWLFELAEGNLSPKQIEQLELFLLQNPELDIDRDVWEMAKIAKQPVAYPDEAKLTKKRPVGWYIGGSVALTSLFLLLWFTVPMLTGQHDLLARNTDRKEVRVFVINKNTTPEANSAGTNGSLQGTEFENDRSSVQGGYLANAQSGTVNHITAEGSQNFGTSDEFASTQQNGFDQNVSFAQEFLDGGVNSVTNPALTGTGSEEVNDLAAWNSSYSNGNSQENNAGVNVEMLAAFEVDGLPIQEASEITMDLNREPATMRFSKEQLIYQEDALAHNFQERSSNQENESTQPSSTHQTFSSGYHASFKSKMSALGRRIQRMMDNPVALKNFKDPHFHVPGMLPNDINFSSTGTMLSTRVQTLSRIQWMGQESEQLMNQLAVDGYAYSLRGGIGLQLNHGLYRNGGISVASAAITYSPKISISRKVSVEPSLRFKMGNKTLANSKMLGVNQVEIDRGNDLAFYPESEPIGNMLWYHDLGAGLMVNTEWFYAGIQLDNLFRHYDNIYDVNIESARRSPNHFVATIGTDWVSKRENLSMSPYIVYQNYGALSEAWAGLNFRLSWFTMGASVSTSLEPAASIGLKFDHFALTYNADYTKSVMTGAPALSHQLTLRFVSKPSRFGKRLLNI